MPSAPALHPLDLDATNVVVETYDPKAMVDWAAKEFKGGLVMSSSFGAESALLIHLATRALPDIRIIFIDTGYLFSETHAFMEDLRHRFDLNLWVYRTRNDPIEYLSRAGETDPTVRRDVENCCAVNKNEPFDRAMRQLQPAAWLRGIRRQQGESRAARKPVEWSDRYQCYAISPLLNWGRREIHQYLKQHDLPYHPMFDRGFTSIGCNPLTCTRAIQPGEDPRSGRWAGMDKVECGLHLENGAGI